VGSRTLEFDFTERQEPAPDEYDQREPPRRPNERNERNERNEPNERAERNERQERIEPHRAAPDEGPRTFSVGELGRVIRRRLEEGFRAPVWVEGEVANARPASSGHVYFTLKDADEEATLDIAIYKSALTPRTRGFIQDGKRIRLRGRPQFWPPRGRLQFVADQVQLAGRGAILEALEKLKTKLTAEGLFAPERKRALPHAPRIVGVVTSASGAVIHDVAKVAFRRGGANILLAPALVQGFGAADSVMRAIAALERVRGVDVIIVGRGGGSSEDLMAWNDEALVRMIASCSVPIVSAVGHEVDVTLADFAADARAATPSQAAEMVVPVANAERRLLAHLGARLGRVMKARATAERHELSRLLYSMPNPAAFVAELRQDIDASREELADALRERLRREHGDMQRVDARLARRHPRAVLVRERADVEQRARALHVEMEKRVAEGRGDLGALFARLDAMSPLKVLARGYAIATTEDGRAVRNADEVSAGDRVNIRVAEGAFAAIVEGEGSRTISIGERARSERKPSS
jgi:exodeoxyribonuclease VII large subunit